MSYALYRPLDWYELSDKKDKAHMIQANIGQQIALLDTEGTYDISFQYFYTQTAKEGKKPRITVCYISTPGICSIGFAFCSMRDEPDKLVGQTIALCRAYKALVKESYTHPIGNPEVDYIIAQSDMSSEYDPTFKGACFPADEPRYRIPRVPF